MAKHKPDHDAAFLALADPTRRAIVERLANGEATVSQLAAPFDMALPSVSKHLRVLERAGLMTQERVGRTRVCRLNRAPLDDLAAWLGRYTDFWNDKLDALAAHIERSEHDATTTPEKNR
jgi:DNA-binding transcriptional ArsR family regulator